MELVEAEEAVGEDDGVAGCSCGCLEGRLSRGWDEDTRYLARIVA